MAIMSNDDVAGFGEAEPAADTEGPSGRRSDASVKAAESPERVWVLCRKRADGEVDTIRAFDDEARARADLELAESVSGDQFWLSAVPLMQTDSAPARGMSRVQALALTWLAQGAEAESSVPLDDPVVVSPHHVRGFVSVPSHEWREMEERGWVRDGLITPDGADRVGLAHPRKRAERD